MADIEIMLAKEGPELFREMLRHFSEAEVEDYYKLGVWKDADMKMDLELILQHRREAGAPDPPPLEEVTLPELPAVKTMPGLSGLGAGLSLNLPGAAKVALGGGMTVDIKEMALFVAKHKLDPAKTKTMLLPLTPTRRKYVLGKFEAKDGDAIASLEAFIKECEASKAWDTETPTPLKAAANPPSIRPVAEVTKAPVVLGANAPAAAVPVRPALALGGGGVKRPIMLGGGGEAPKRPHLAPGLAPAAAAPVVRPALKVPARPQGGGGLLLGTPRPAATITPAAAKAPIRLVAPGR